MGAGWRTRNVSINLKTANLSGQRVMVLSDFPQLSVDLRRESAQADISALYITHIERNRTQGHAMPCPSPSHPQKKKEKEQKPKMKGAGKKKNYT